MCAWISAILMTQMSRYCFGAPYVCDELAGETVTAGAFAHPAFLKEHHFFNLKSTLLSVLPSSLANDAWPQSPSFFPALISTIPLTRRRGAARWIYCVPRTRHTSCSCSMGWTTASRCGEIWRVHSSVSIRYPRENRRERG